MIIEPTQGLCYFLDFRGKKMKDKIFDDIKETDKVIGEAINKMCELMSELLSEKTEKGLKIFARLER
jgi:hypothetical protein